MGNTGTVERHSNGFTLILNRASQEKILIGFLNEVDKAGVAPEESVCHHLFAKWRNVANEISTITITAALGNFVAGSRVILMGVKT
ncbi:unnamed protein product [marine sediment metagenome]|uniref:Uncharacterized protein n=1 Tax=marine sediment metagenome TaxID=412755 RepID=X1RNL3_9ZZZZ